MPVTIAWILSRCPASMTGPRATVPEVGSPTGRWSARAASAATYVVGDARLHQVPSGRHADLALVGEGPPRPDRGRGLDVDVVEHEQRRVAAELEVHPLEVLGRERADRAAGPGRPGEGDHPHGPARRPAPRPRRRRRAARAARPSGRPASAKISASTAPPLTAVRGSGLSSTALPSASAGATARMDEDRRHVERRDDPDHPDRQPPARGSAAGWTERSSSPYGAEASAAAS